MSIFLPLVNRTILYLFTCVQSFVFPEKVFCCKGLLANVALPAFGVVILGSVMLTKLRFKLWNLFRWFHTQRFRGRSQRLNQLLRRKQIFPILTVLESNWFYSTMNNYWFFNIFPWKRFFLYKTRSSLTHLFKNLTLLYCLICFWNFYVPRALRACTFLPADSYSWPLYRPWSK